MKVLSGTNTLAYYAEKVRQHKHLLSTFHNFFLSPIELQQNRLTLAQFLPCSQSYVKPKKVLSGTNAMAYYAEQSMMKKKRPENIDTCCQHFTSYFFIISNLVKYASIFTFAPFMPYTEILGQLKKVKSGTNALAYYAKLSTMKKKSSITQTPVCPHSTAFPVIFSALAK